MAKIPKIDREKLPTEVLTALDSAGAYLTKQFSGRYVVPEALVVTVPIPEAGEGTSLYAVLVAPTGADRKEMNTAALTAGTAREKGGAALAAALDKFADRNLVSCCHWVGIPAQAMVDSDGEVTFRPAMVMDATGDGPKADPKVRARDFLRKLQDEPGTLADAFSEVSNQIAEMLAGSPSGALGKP